MRRLFAFVMVFFMLCCATIPQAKADLGSFNLSTSIDTKKLTKFLLEKVANQEDQQPTYAVDKNSPAYVLQRLQDAIRNLDLDALFDVFDTKSLLTKTEGYAGYAIMDAYSTYSDGKDLFDLLKDIIGDFDLSSLPEFLWSNTVEAALPLIALFCAEKPLPNFYYTVHSVINNGDTGEVVASIYGDVFEDNNASFPPLKIMTKRTGSSWVITDIVEYTGDLESLYSDSITGNWELAYCVLSSPVIGNIKLTMAEIRDNFGVNLTGQIRFSADKTYSGFAFSGEDSTIETGTWKTENGKIFLSGSRDDIFLTMYGDELRLSTDEGMLYFTRIDSIADATQLFTYDIQEDDTAIIKGSTNEETTKNTVYLTIPSELDGHPITKIGEEAFANYVNLVAITLPETITSIEDSAFSNCKSLPSIDIPDSVTYIGAGAFNNCTSLTSIALPEGIVSIESNTFNGCTSLASITIPDDIVSIGAYAFSGCKSLASFIIPENVTVIGAGAFKGCTSLTSITIPNSVTSIEEHAFDSCSALSSIDLPDNITSIERYTFASCTSLANITFPESVTSIEEYAFYYCHSLTTINIPDTVVKIGNSAFAHCIVLYSINIPTAAILDGNPFTSCSGLRTISIAADHPVYEVVDNVIFDKINKELVYFPATYRIADSYTIPDGIVSIGQSAFAQCKSLKKLTIPNSVTSIGDNAFMGCDSLCDIIIPDSVTFIGNSAFRECDSLTSVIIPSTVTSLGAYAFYYCKALSTVTIQDGVTAIKDHTFTGCESLTNIDIPTSVSSIGEAAFSKTNLSSLPLPNSITTIEASTFSYCNSLVSITIPDGITVIGASAFTWCKNLEEVILPESVTNIEKSVFLGCESLSSINIPDSVISIGDCAFDRCSNLKHITIPYSVKNIGNEVFYSVISNITVTVYYDSYAAQYCKDNDVNHTYIQDDDYLEYINSVIESSFATPSISAGISHTVGLKSDGTVVAIGNNEDGRCDVSSWTDIVAISAGGYHTVGLKSDGTVVAIGYNSDDRCDVSSWTDIIAISAGSYHTVGLKADGTVVAVGNNKDGRCDVSSWTDIVAISAGGYHTVGLKADGTVVAIGYNSDGRCDVSSWTNIVAISAGSYHTVGLKSDGTVVAVGSNNNEKCNVSGWIDIVAISAGETHTIGLKSDGTVVSVGSNNNRRSHVSEWIDIVAISTAKDHTVGLKSDGTVVATGSPEYQKTFISDWNLGFSHRKNPLIAVPDVTEPSIAVPDVTEPPIVAPDVTEPTIADSSSKTPATIKPSVYAKGDRTVGLKSDGTVVQVGWIRSYDAPVTEWENITSISLGNGFTLGLRRDGTVVMSHGEEKLDIAINVNVSKWTDIIAIAAGGGHAVGLKSDGTVVATSGGNNSYYQCDVTTWTDIVAISAGSGHTVGLKSDGTVVAVGDNSDGQCNVAEWTDIVAISAGYDHTVGLKSDGTVVTTYDSDTVYYIAYDAIYWTDIVAISAGEYYTVGLKADGTVVAVGENKFDKMAQINVSGWTDIVAISAGNNHVVGLKSDGTVVVTGHELYGKFDVEQWDLGDSCLENPLITESVATEPVVTDPNLFAYSLKDDGTIVINGFIDSEISKNIKQLVIPAQIDGLSVSEIGKKAFYNNDTIKSVIIPNGVKTLGASAFNNCNELWNVFLPDTLESIGAQTFMQCLKLGSIILPNGLKSIDSYAFSGNYLEKVVLPEGLLSLGNYAFDNSFRLKTIVFPNSLTSIGTNMFGYYEYYEPPENVIVVPGSCAEEYCKAHDIVYTTAELAIIKQPVSATVKNGDTVKAEVVATGDGLTYTWWVKEPDSNSYTTSSITGNVYSYKMTTAKSGRKVFCMITDSVGNFVKSETVTLSGPATVAITKQPTDATAFKGEKAVTTIEATGEGLTYQWYYKNPGSSKFKASSIITAECAVTMTDDRDGREMYCVVTDEYGNEAKSKTITLSIIETVEIITQPKSVSIAEGKTAKFTVKATGDGLKYQWYYQNPGEEVWKECSGTEATYSTKAKSSRNGRQFYCEITDAYGNIAKTKTVKLTVK